MGHCMCTWYAAYTKGFNATRKVCPYGPSKRELVEAWWAGWEDGHQ